MTKPGITIKHLVFTRTHGETAELSFASGLNIVYGASDTGKSFTAQALAFMLGAATNLPKTPEITNYQGALLGLVLPDGREVTLFRSTKGGSFRLHEGLRKDADAKSGEILLGKADKARTDTVSHFLLQSLGLAGKEIVKSASADKAPLSIRLLAPFVIVGEDDILSKRSPVLTSGQFTNQTLERNLFRLLVTGNDDAAAVTVTSAKTKTVQNSAKIELIDELLEQIEADLGEAFDEGEFEAASRSVSSAVSSLQDDLGLVQRRLDDLVIERRSNIDSQRELKARIAELDLTLERFRSLSAVYSQDVARLAALEEGGFILRAFSSRDCSICGAPPSAQRHNHAAEDIERAYAAARAEAAKILIEQRELQHTTNSLQAEAKGLGVLLSGKAEELDALETEIAETRPREATLRETFEELAAMKAGDDRIMQMILRRDHLRIRKSQLESLPKAVKVEKLAVGVDGTIAYDFGAVVREVLTEWGFPDGDKAQFDPLTQDVTIAGKPREASGKGVRAILHAAFNVALLLFCRRRDLPHPGFLILDTPLLTYREPLTSRHGELSEDEKELVKTDLPSSFYTHLAGLRDFAQIIVLENSTPPQSAHALAKVQVFSGKGGAGRQALFPMEQP